MADLSEYNLPNEMDKIKRAAPLPHPYPGPEGGMSLPVGATDTHEQTNSPAYRQGREALRISREVRPGLREAP